MANQLGLSSDAPCARGLEGRRPSCLTHFRICENTFEKQFVHEEDLQFRAVARRNKALALWVADMKGLSKGDAEKYADQFVGAQVGRSDDDVAAALREDLARGDINLSDHRLRKRMDDAMAEAIVSVKAGK